MIKIVTDTPFCTDQPDFTIHAQDFNPLDSGGLDDLKVTPLKLNCSAGADNHTDARLISESLSRFDGSVNCLDLGCAGGSLILDYNQRPQTEICIGLDGSCGVYKHNNWHQEENKKVLRHADLTKPFSIENEKSEKIKFDIITCWEVIEHFEEKDLDSFFTNVSNHLSDKGIFFGSIALFEDVRDTDGFHQDHPMYKPDTKQYLLHKTVYDNNKQWDEILKKYFEVKRYNFEIELRNHSDSYYFTCKHK